MNCVLDLQLSCVVLLVHISIILSAVWKGEWEECVGEEYEQAQQMPESEQSAAKPSPDSAAMASYQFQIRARQPNAGRWGPRLLLGLAVGEKIN